MPRRDKCHAIGRRAQLLAPAQSIHAWHLLARDLEALGEKDVPKFRDLLDAIRTATIQAKRPIHQP